MEMRIKLHLKEEQNSKLQRLKMVKQRKYTWRKFNNFGMVPYGIVKIIRKVFSVIINETEQDIENVDSISCIKTYHIHSFGITREDFIKGLKGGIVHSSEVHILLTI